MRRAARTVAVHDDASLDPDLVGSIIARHLDDLLRLASIASRREPRPASRASISST